MCLVIFLSMLFTYFWHSESHKATCWEKQVICSSLLPSPEELESFRTAVAQIQGTNGYERWFSWWDAGMGIS